MLVGMLHINNESISVQSDLHPSRSLLDRLASLLPSHLLRHLRLENHLVSYLIYSVIIPEKILLQVFQDYEGY